ncbi:MAG: rRNA maturation RNase YbeY [Paludibacteraceae bacterium]|nr:rRNA maturation RNase YbeY [Paludibacteraceae bacterium]
MMISYHTEDIKKPNICTRRTSAWVKNVAASHGKTIGEIAYIFCSDPYILEVNKQYLQHDYFTDVITFDYTEGNKISGDIFISLDTVQSNAEQFGVDFYEELERVIIHGILHLCGFKDKEEAEEAQMREEENKAISSLEKPLKK